MRTILVGIDGSANSRAALAWAIGEAELHDADVVALMAWDYLAQPHRSGGSSSFDPDFDADDARRVVTTVVDEVLDDLGGARVEVEPRAVLDLPARALLEAAADADLLVVGRRGLGGFKSLVLGSVSQAVLGHAPCPVLVIPDESA